MLFADVDNSDYQQAVQYDVRQMQSRLLPPRQLGGHLLRDLDGVGDAVALALVDGVTDNALAPLGEIGRAHV